MEKRKSPILAVLLSVLWPGLGQLYNGHYAKGIALLGLVLAIHFLSREPTNIAMEFNEKGMLAQVPNDTVVLILVYALAALLITGVAIYDAVVVAKKINKGDI